MVPADVPRSTSRRARDDDGYFHAPAEAQSSLKLAFMHAADQLDGPRAVRTNELVDPQPDGRKVDADEGSRTGHGRRATTVSWR